MKTNMKIALSLITVPYTISFLSGMFGWYAAEGMLVLMGMVMIGGIVWAWVIESKR